MVQTLLYALFPPLLNGQQKAVVCPDLPVGNMTKAHSSLSGPPLSSSGRRGWLICIHSCGNCMPTFGPFEMIGLIVKGLAPSAVVIHSARGIRVILSGPKCISKSMQYFFCTRFTKECFKVILHPNLHAYLLRGSVSGPGDLFPSVV